MEISFTQTPVNRLLAIRSFYKNHPHEKMQNAIGLIFGPVFTFALITLLNSMQSESASFSEINNLGLTLLCTLPPSIIFGGAGYLAYRSYKQKFQNIYPKDLPDEYFGETTISIDLDGLHISTPLVSHSYDWSMISFLESDECLYFYFLRHLYAFIPTDTIKSNEDLGNFTNQVRIYISNTDDQLLNQHSA